MRLLNGFLIVAVLLMVAGGICFAFPGDGEVVFGFVSSANDERAFPAILFLTTRRVIGIALFASGALVAAGLVGYRIGAHHP